MSHRRRFVLSRYNKAIPVALAALSGLVSQALVTGTAAKVVAVVLLCGASAGVVAAPANTPAD